MGKYMKQSKITGDIAVMDSIGVRTRAKTLALQRLQRPDPDDSSFCYLQLRSRCLVKQRHTDKTCTRQNPNPIIPTSTNESFGKDEGTESAYEASFGDNNLDFGHRDRFSYLSSQPLKEFTRKMQVQLWFIMSSRESTPCSFRTSDTTETPGSTTRWRSVPTTYQERRNDLRIVPTCEIEEFFACPEQQQERLFIKKYNFDVVNDMPLPGRYEWVEVRP
ncbi:hypothetical protein Ddye_016105 [Dipteronia dyeriana]|uniref:Cyclin-dependent kinase inhibitor n=1 Tax=Dipteronia dyeriana TaxID=168575 RepID=A0AAD9WZ88_9ROSI|nr:hypothetical protein Ddye_016105 [Dipteronia dyeriana]